jgi:predicted nuclease of predicted toxin-antitoxin system
MEIASIHLVLDQGLPRDAAGQLRSAGASCVHVGELKMSTAADTEILEWARVHNSVIVTLDADFHAIVAVQRVAKPSVIRIRVQGLNGTAIAGLVRQVLERYAVELRLGCMITVKPRKTTCHLLPTSD